MFKQIHMVHKPGKFAFVLAGWFSVVLKNALCWILIVYGVKIQVFTEGQVMNQIKWVNLTMDFTGESYFSLLNAENF